jgi:hypothetical protein
MFKKHALGLIPLCFLAACAAQGPAFTEAPPPGGKALVYIYRPYNKWMAAQDAGFDANGKRIGFLDPGGYTFFHAPPGHYDIHLFWPVGVWTLQTPALWTSDVTLPADFNAGETHYFRLTIDGDIGGFSGNSMQMHVGWRLAEVAPAAARREIAQQKFEPQNKAMPAEFKP